MKARKKDVILVIVELVILFSIILFVVNIDKFFPSPEQTLQPPQAPIFDLDSETLIIVEYSDFECPFSADVLNTVTQIRTLYAGQVEIVFKHFPLHTHSQKAAEASECARDQGMFWEYHNILFENQRSLDVASLKRLASELALDTEAFDSCLDNGEKASLVFSDYQDAVSQGVRGTPTFFINDQVLEGAQPLINFERVIEDELHERNN